ncbi:hypothetical protein [Streptomyces roseicoloratus]|uniref:hypothetical protein n=1 Tax=Streptomyces roseicoloratus TaxID=2508722 RepID=UPI001009CCA6|nr:hypothetical protein [Streptomyces roseicoloratus]
MPSAAIRWSDPTSEPIVDELRRIEILRSTGAPLPVGIITSRKARATYYGSVNGSTTPTAVLATNEVEVVRDRYNLQPNPEFRAETRCGVTVQSLVLTSGTNPAIEEPRRTPMWRVGGTSSSIDVLAPWRHSSAVSPSWRSPFRPDQACPSGNYACRIEFVISAQARRRRDREGGPDSRPGRASLMPSLIRRHPESRARTAHRRSPSRRSVEVP